MVANAIAQISSFDSKSIPAPSSFPVAKTETAYGRRWGRT